MSLRRSHAARQNPLGYTLNQWQYPTRYTVDCRMPIDHNLLPRDIRVFATGRKRWLFSDTVDGAKASPVVYSLMQTCRACVVEPFAWLKHVLTELARRPDEADIDDLMPFNFKRQRCLIRRPFICIDDDARRNDRLR